MKRLLLLAGMALCLSSFAATEVTWVGGEVTDGNWSTASNWDPKVKPTSADTYKAGEVAYIAVFTNSVTITAGGNWNLGGIKVRDNATVTMNAGQVKASTAIEGAELSDEFVTDVETGSELNFTGSSAIGRAGLTWVVKGGGSVKHTNSTGWNAAGSTYDYLRIEKGSFHSPSTEGYAYFLKGAIVRDGGTFVCRAQNALNVQSSKSYHVPLTLEAGGVYDCGGKIQDLYSLEGAGVVTNLGTYELKVRFGLSGKTFSGKVYGKLTVCPVSGETPADSRWIIGDTNTLADVTEFKITTVSGCTTDVRFAAGIGTFYGQKVPAVDLIDTDGKYVYIDRKPRWYVDGSRAASGDGKTAATAFKTLKEAYQAAQAYDKVLVLPGTYAGEPCSMDSTTSNRLTVANYVSFASTEGPEKTIIVGAPPPSPDATTGLGDYATRCAYLGLDARLEGFTLTGGWTQKENRFGGGVLTADATALLVNCIITNNVSSRGGGGANGSYIRCRIDGNLATKLGSAVCGTVRLYDCSMNGNLKGAYVVYSQAYAGTFVNTTFGPDNTADDDIRAGDSGSNYVDFYNCLTMLGIFSGSQRVRLHRTFTTRTLPSGATADDDCWVTNLTVKAEKIAAAGIGTDLVPVLGSPLVDAGSNSYACALYPVGLKALWGLDASGSPRIRGTSVDVGAYEYDPSGDYPRVLALDDVALAALTVPSATGSIVIRDDSKALRLADGAAITVGFVKSSAATTTYTFQADVIGEGSLAVYVNGAAEPSLAVTAATSGLKSVADAANVTLRFVYAGDGYADLSTFANETAFTLAIANGGVTVTGATPGRNVVAYDSSASVTFTRTYDSEKLCTGLLIDGETIDFDDWPDGYAHVFLGTERSKVVSVEAVYAAECHAWYVSPTGSDANRGYHPNAAWKTPVYAGTNGCVQSGDTIYLAPGEYAEGYYADAYARRYRTYVPDGVTLTVSGANGSAVIVGAPATTAEDAYGIGLGADAVSCVGGAATAHIVGLTLRDGRTPNLSNSYGGGVHGPQTVEDCIFTNCAARRSGAVWGGTCRRCRFYANNAAETTAVAEGTKLYDCVFRNNANLRSLTEAYNTQIIRNCTFFLDKPNHTAANWPSGKWAVSNMVNCVLRAGQSDRACYTCCAFLAGAPDFVSDANMGEGSFRFTADEAAAWLGADGRLKSDAGFIDRGVVADDYDGTLDADRSQRIYNGMIDLGAYEYDWRPDFRAALTRKPSVTVTAASEMVTTNATGGVLLPGDGATVATTWQTTVGKKAFNTFVVEVAGAGELVYTLNGVEIRRFTAADGRCTVEFANALGANDVRLAFAGEGSAVISDFKCDKKGLQLIIR